jgi:type IV pilus assembly protein PilX
VASNKPAASSFVAACTGALPAQPVGRWYQCLGAQQCVYRHYATRCSAHCTITGETLQKPRYTVELLDSNYTDAVTGTTGASLYRITSRAWGRNANTQVTLQSYYVVS